MALITPEFEALMKGYPLKSQGKTKNALAIARFYLQEVNFYILEYDRESKNALIYIN